MNKPTKEQILAEADALEKMIPNVRHFSGFGDNHHDAIDAQVRVLRDYANDEIFSEEEVECLVNDELDNNGDNVRDAAIQAFQWAEGEDANSDGNQPPSKDWESLVQK